MCKINIFFIRYSLQSLANNRIGGLGAQALKEMLEYNSNLSELSLSGKLYNKHALRFI